MALAISVFFAVNNRHFRYERDISINDFLSEVSRRISSVRGYFGQRIHLAGTTTESPTKPEMRMRMKSDLLRPDPGQDYYAVLNPSQVEEQTADDSDSELLRYEALAHQMRLSSERSSLRSIEGCK